MSYRFRRGETLGVGARRIAREVIDRTLTCLGDGDVPAEVRTHEARKSVKRLRGLMRLVAPDLKSREHAKSLDRKLKKTGKILARVRDEDVMRTTLSMVACDDNQAAAVAKAGSIAGKPKKVSNRDFASAAKNLAVVRRKIGEWQFSGNRPRNMEAGYIGAYRESRRRMKKALNKRTDAQFHRWREMVKYHSYHTHLLTNLDGGELAARREKSRALEEVLGKHHDLAMLEHRLRSEKKKKKVGGVPVAKLRSRIRKMRAGTEREAVALGKSLFAEKPRRARKDLPL